MPLAKTVQLTADSKCKGIKVHSHGVAEATAFFAAIRSKCSYCVAAAMAK